MVAALTSVSCGAPVEATGDGADTVGKAQLGLHSVPNDVWEARGSTAARVYNLANAYARKFATDGELQLWSEGTRGLRTAGALIQLYKTGAIDPDTDAMLGGWAPVRSRLEDFMYSISGHHDVGTDPAGEKKDYDMVLKELATLLYSNIYAPDYLTNEMVFNIVCQDTDGPADKGGCVYRGTMRLPTGVASFSRQELRKTAYLGFAAGTWSETENHVLMTHSYKYLINNYVKWAANLPEQDPRYDERIKALYDASVRPGGDRRYENEGGQLEDYILQMLGRILHNGMFEENAKAYESLSLHAIMNLYQGANALFQSPGQEKVRTAAQNALDYLLTKFAFQSYEGKRMPATRRNWSYKERRGFYNNDYVPEMIGVMSGGYVFDDDFKDGSVDQFHHVTSRYYYERINAPEMGEAQGYALWAGLFWMNSPYWIPIPVHEYLLGKPSFYARMQTFYTKDHYGKHEPLYFPNGSPHKPASTYQYDTGARDRNGRPIMATGGVFSSSPEFYFGGPGYLNSSGGYYRPYYDVGLAAALPGDWGSDASTAYHQYDFTAKPTTLITSGDVGQHWGDTGDDYAEMSQDVLSMKGNWNNPGASQNVWVYKNFAYGYTWEKDVSSNYHTYWPQKYPPLWNDYATPPARLGRAWFKVIDLTRVPVSRTGPSWQRHGFYVVLGQFSKSSSDRDFWNYARGIWEVVPSGRFTSKEALLDAVLANNKQDWYNDSTSSHYYYKTIVSGETLKLDNKVGAGVSYQSIMEIKDRNGNVQDLNKVFVKMASNPADDLRTTLPLLDVQEVDDDFNFTGRTLASAPGDGTLTVTNPRSGYTLRIDSSNYRNPTRPQEN